MRVLTLFVLLVFGCTLLGCSTRLASPKPVPASTLVDSDGVKFSLDEYKGTVLLVDVWAHWCAPCKKALPTIQAIHEDYLDDPRVVVLGVHGDPNGAAASEVLREKNVTFRQVLDGGPALAKELGVSGYPTFFVVSADGQIVHQKVGASGGLSRSLRSAIKEELAELSG
ncbi:MAG: TlpA disulfide reductase family protein [Planctomycetota bacterium]